MSANLDGERGDELWVRSGWGIGVLKRSGAQVWPRASAPFGSSLGGWVLGAQDQVVGASDFDGDGRDEVVLRSAWGIGIVGLDAQNRWRLLASSPNDRSLGGWFMRAPDTIEAVADVNGDRRAEIVLRSGWRIAAVGIDASGAQRVVGLTAHGSIAGWSFAASDRVMSVSDLDGDGRLDLLLESTWGFGVLGWTGAGSRTAPRRRSARWSTAGKSRGWRA